MSEKKNNSRGPFTIQKTVLVVDDEIVNRVILTGILENDFNVLEAVDGQEALDILLKEHKKIDLVLLDVFMPFDGREVLKVRQQNPELKKIPFIVCTSDKNIEEECFQLGVNDFVKKPYENPDIIVARVRRMIELYEDRSILREMERDKLTNLLTPEFFVKYGEQFDQLYKDTPKDMVSVSINRFRLINELYGRAFGDEVLLAISSMLSNCIMNCNGIVCRSTSSTFMIYCEHHDNYEMLAEKLNNLLHNLRPGINISFRIGVYPNVDPSLDKDFAMARTKGTADTLLNNNYSKNIAVYDENIQAKSLHMEELLNAFDEALEKEQFKLFFQPKYAIQGDKPVFSSAEVLVRWISPQFGFVSPGDFIPLFEENGLIPQLDAYILKKSADFMHLWKEKYGLIIPLSINISRVDIYRPNLIEDIIHFVDDNDLPRDKYFLEITESAFVEDSREVIPFLSRLRDQGFKVEIDDFGSGYSSFGALADLPFDVLKIDMAFIRAMDKNPKVKDIIKMVIQLAKTMDSLTVAEGVETEEQYLFLKENGCDIIQGYYFSRPLPQSDFETLIEEEVAK